MKIATLLAVTPPVEVVQANLHRIQRLNNSTASRQHPKGELQVLDHAITGERQSPTHTQFVPHPISEGLDNVLAFNVTCTCQVARLNLHKVMNVTDGNPKGNDAHPMKHAQAVHPTRTKVRTEATMSYNMNDAGKVFNTYKGGPSQQGAQGNSKST